MSRVIVNLDRSFGGSAASPPYANVRYDARNIGVAGSGLNDVNGAVTTIGVEVLSSATYGFADHSGASTGNNSGVYSDIAQQYGWGSANNFTFKIFGLIPNTGYNIKIFSSGPSNYIDTQRVSINGGSDNTMVNVVDNTSFTNDYTFSSDQNGDIAFTFKPDLFRVYIQVIEIEEAGDSQAPTVPTNLSLVSKTHEQVSITWDPSTDNVGVEGYNLYKNGVYDGFTTGTSYTFTSLDPETEYNFTVSAYDAALNESAQSTVLTETTNAAPDTTPPSDPTNLALVSKTDTTIDINWTPSTDNVGVDYYDIIVDDVDIDNDAAPPYQITGLSATNQYSIKVRAVDTSGNPSGYSNILTVTTDSPPDTTAPSVPVNVQAAFVTHNSTRITWPASTDDTAVEGYKVFRDGVEVGDVSTLYFDDLGLTELTEYSYTVLAYDAASNQSAQSSAVIITTLQAPFAPVATTHPTPNTISAGLGVTFTGAFSGNPTPTLQWQVNTGSGWSDISGETSETLNFVSQRAQNGYEYRLKGENSEGIEYTNAATLTVEFEAIVDTNPQDITINEGLIASFNSTYTDGNPNASILWQENTGSGWNDLTGESGTTLSFTANRTKSGNQYRLKVSNSEGTVYSSPATLSVNWLEITTQPQDATIDDDQSETLIVSVDGNPSASYQWQIFDGGWSDINGATSSTYQFTPGTIEIPQEDFLFRVVVSNAFGSFTSEQVTVTVNKSAVLPVFTLQPQNVTVQELQQAIFEIDFSGYPTPSILWKKNSQTIVGETSKTMVLNTVLSDDGSVITAEIENIAGTVVSNQATLNVTAIPDPGDTVYVLNIVDHGQEVSIGSNDSISARAYQWQTFNSQVQDYEDITGETNQSLTITIGENVNQNIYRLMADNTPSAGFQLNVIPSGEPSWFITQAEVIKIAFEKGNTNTGYIKDVKIRVSENEYIRPAITEALFIHLNQDNLNLTEKEVVLKDMIKEPLAYFVKALCIPEMSIQLGNKGAQLVRGDYSQSGSSKERGELKDSALKIGNSLLKNAVKFIEENSNDFPLYEKSNSVRTTAPRRRGGLLLGGNN